MSSTPPPHLILHFDVNETIVVEDVAGNQNQSECLNKIIAKSVLLSNTNTPPTHFIDGTPLDPPSGAPDQPLPSFHFDPLSPEAPPSPFHFEFKEVDSATSYYKAFLQGKGNSERVTNFHTHPHGKYFEGLRETLVQALKCDPSFPEEFKSKKEEEAEGDSLFIVPAFFKTIYHLTKNESRVLGEDLTIVIRTFGHDKEKVLKAIEAFGRGEHPHYPDFQSKELQNIESYRGRYDGERGFHLFPFDGEGRVTAEEKEVMEKIYSSGCVFVQDDYTTWKKNDYLPQFGKPLWMLEGVDKEVIFFDDWIQDNANDSIVAVRKGPPEGPFKALPGHETVALEGELLCRVFTVLAVLDDEYFLKQIERCRKKRQQK